MQEIKIEEIDNILNDLSEEIRIRDLEIRAKACGTHFTNNYVIQLRDEYNENQGRFQAIQTIKGKILELQETKRSNK